MTRIRGKHSFVLLWKQLLWATRCESSFSSLLLSPPRWTLFPLLSSRWRRSLRLPSRVLTCRNRPDISSLLQLTHMGFKLRSSEESRPAKKKLRIGPLGRWLALFVILRQSKQTLTWLSLLFGKLFNWSVSYRSDSPLRGDKSERCGDLGFLIITRLHTGLPSHILHRRPPSKLKVS